MNMFDVLLAKKLAGGGDIPEPILIEKNITANGDYLASADNADGYSSVVVNVPSSNYDVKGNLVVESGVANDLDLTAVIPEGVTEIGQSMFYQMTKLKSVSFPSTLTTLGQSSFKNTGISSLTLRSSITTVSSAVFMYCHQLTSVEINGSSLGSSMFQGCENIESIDFSSCPDTKLAEQVCQACTKLSSVVFPSGCTRIGRAAFNSCTALKSITIPNTVTYLETGVFQGAGLESIVIPNSVTTLSSSAFINCTSLASVDIGSGVNGFQGRTFSGCTSLMSITLRKTSGVVNYGTDDFKNVPANCDIYVPADLVDTYKASSFWSARADYIHAIPA